MKSSKMINLALAIAAGVLLVTVIGYNFGQSLARKDNAARIGKFPAGPSVTLRLY